MIIAIIILSGLLLCSIFIILTLWYALSQIIDEYLDNNPKVFVDYYLTHESKNKFPCTLLISIQENAEFEGTIYDFSKYEESNIIGLIEYKKDNSFNGKFQDEDGNPVPAFLPNQIVYEMKDGSFQWDFRHLM